MVLVRHMRVISGAWYIDADLQQIIYNKATEFIKSGTHWDREKKTFNNMHTHSCNKPQYMYTYSITETSLSAHLLIPSDQHLTSVFVVFNGHSISFVRI